MEPQARVRVRVRVRARARVRVGAMVTGLPSLICCIDGRLRSGRASLTIEARVSMKAGSVESVGTRTKERMPLEAARAAYL